MELKVLKQTAKVFLALGLASISYACTNTQEMKQELKQDDQLKAFRSNVNEHVYQLPKATQIQPFAERLYKGVEESPRSRSAESFRALSEEGLGQYEQAKAFDEQLLFSDANTIFYPGALLKTSSVISGEYTPIAAPRKKIKISTSLTGKGNVSVEVENPSLSSVRSAISQLLNQDEAFNAPPADITYSSEEVHDEDHLKLALGANYQGTKLKVKGSTNFTYQSDKKYFIVKVQQVFFTLDLDLPASPSDFFADEFDYKNAFGQVKPLYVSTIKMGRVLLLGVETSLTKADFEANLQASFGETIEGNAEVAYNKIKESSKISGRAIGGNSELAANAVNDIKAIKKFLTEGATYSKDNLGAPIAYQLRELGTNDIFKTVIYSRYNKNRAFEEKISFTLYLSKDKGLNLRIGGVETNFGRVFLELTSLDGNKTSKELKFEWDGSRQFIKPRINQYASGDVLELVFDRSDLGDKQKHVFTFPTAEALIQRAKKTNKGYNLYDESYGIGTLDLTSKDKEYVIKLELENQAVTK